MNWSSSSRAVVVRPALDSPMRVSPAPVRASSVSVPARSDLAVSARVRAGTTTAAAKSGCDGFQVSSDAAIRYLSVHASLIRSPSMSTRTPVSIGRVSSRLAATTTRPIAAASAPLSTSPAMDGRPGGVG